MSVETAVGTHSPATPHQGSRPALTMIVLTFPPGKDIMSAPLKPATPTWRHTRGLSRSAQALLVEGSRRSATINAMLTELEQSDLIVDVSDVMPGGGSVPSSYLSFTHYDGTSRYVLIRIDRFRLSSHERIIWLGHELQHALEVAAAPEVTDSDGLARLLRRIGWESVQDRFEALEASMAGNQVRSEIYGTPLLNHA